MARPTPPTAEVTVTVTAERETTPGGIVERLTISGPASTVGEITRRRAS